MMTQQLDIRGSGQSYAIYRGKARISRFYSGNMAALAAVRGVEARLKPVTARACLSCGTRFNSLGCGTRFNSLGCGNRLCDRCRKEA